MRFNLTYGTVWGETRLTGLGQSLTLLSIFIGLCCVTALLGPQFVAGAFLGFVLGLLCRAYETAKQEQRDDAGPNAETERDW
jgi:hypothetical protein